MNGIYFVIMLSIFAADMAIKDYVGHHISEGRTISKWGGRIRLHNHHNKGMIFNYGEKKRAVIAVFSTILTIAVMFVFLGTLGKRGNEILRLGLSLLLGGAFSNTYDRLRRKYVVDYISFQVRWKWFSRIIFNLSDFCIIIGSLLSAWGYTRG